jgi:hypothetical protein
LSTTSTEAIIESMLEQVRAYFGQAREASTPPCAEGFVVREFALTYPNKEVVINASVTAVPPGATLLGFTVAATTDPPSRTTHCLGVAANAAGLTVPVSVLGASTEPTFAGPTQLTGLVVLSYSLNGSREECLISRRFTVRP